MSVSKAFARVLNQLGQWIVDGTLAIGKVVTSEELERQASASRSVVREAIRALATMGMVESRPRVGVRVLPRSRWNLFDPQLIRWQLEYGQTAQHVTVLNELRIAIEPEAARFAARRADSQTTGQLVSLSGSLWSRAQDADPAAFAEADASFHRLLLRGSGNPMFAQLSSVIGEALYDRLLLPDGEQPMVLADVQLHVDLAHAIQRGASDEAGGIAREIIERGLATLPPYETRAGPDTA